MSARAGLPRVFDESSKELAKQDQGRDFRFDYMLEVLLGLIDCTQ